MGGPEEDPSPTRRAGVRRGLDFPPEPEGATGCPPLGSEGQLCVLEGLLHQTGLTLRISEHPT